MEVIEQATGLLITLILTLAIGVGVVWLGDKIRIPDVVLLLITGVFLGPIFGIINIPADGMVNQVILLGGAAYILFHGGTDIDFKIVAKVWKTILLLATIGVLITATVVGFAASALLGFSFLLAFLLAAVLAPTDPATLIPIFDQVKIRRKVSQTVISESTFNDATGASLVLVLAPVALGIGAFSLSGSIGTFLTEAGVGLAVGVVLGVAYILAVAERYRNMDKYASNLSIVAALAAFLIADVLHGSGFMAAFVAGLMVGNSRYYKHEINPDVMKRTHYFISQNTTIIRIFIFILLGTHVDFALLSKYLWEGLAIVAVFMFIARPLTVFISALPDRKGEWTWRELLFLCWSRETGVIPAALAGILVAMEVPNADVIASITFLAVLVTILLQASTVKPAARLLGLLEEDDKKPGVA